MASGVTIVVQITIQSGRDGCLQVSCEVIQLIPEKPAGALGKRAVPGTGSSKRRAHALKSVMVQEVSGELSLALAWLFLGD